MTATEKPRKMLVAIHGAGMHAGVWGGIAPHLLDYAFMPITLPGHDPKIGGDPLATITEMAAVVQQKMTDVPSAENILIGHSMGALVALAAANHPSVKALVLMGGAAKMAVNDELLKLAVESPKGAASLVVEWGTFAGHRQVEAVRTVIGSIFRSADPRAIGVDLQACHDFQEGEKLAAALDKPVLVVTGVEDRMIKPQDSEALATLIPGAVHTILPDCGHMMMIEKPIETAADIRQFVDNLD